MASGQACIRLGVDGLPHETEAVEARKLQLSAIALGSAVSFYVS